MAVTMSDIKFVPNKDGLADLLKQSEPVIRAHTERVVEAANNSLKPDREYIGYLSEVSTQGRPRGRIWTAGRYARRSNAVHNTLVKLLSGGF